MPNKKRMSKQIKALQMKIGNPNLLAARALSVQAEESDSLVSEAKMRKRDQEVNDIVQQRAVLSQRRRRSTRAFKFAPSSSASTASASKSSASASSAVSSSPPPLPEANASESPESKPLAAETGAHEKTFHWGLKDLNSIDPIQLAGSVQSRKQHRNEQYIEFLGSTTLGAQAVIDAGYRSFDALRDMPAALAPTRKQKITIHLSFTNVRAESSFCEVKIKVCSASARMAVADECRHIIFSSTV